MRPSLSVIDWRSGALLAHHIMPDSLHQLSLRHLAVSPGGNVWFAGQFEGEGNFPETLAGSMNVSASISSFRNGRSGAGLQLLTMSRWMIERSKGYLSSVAVGRQFVIFTSSRGGFAIVVDDYTGAIIEEISMLDCSGVAATDPNRESVGSYAEFEAREREFVITSGTGEIRFVPESPDRSAIWSPHQWDNHIYSI